MNEVSSHQGHLGKMMAILGAQQEEGGSVSGNARMEEGEKRRGEMRTK